MPTLSRFAMPSWTRLGPGCGPGGAVAPSTVEQVPVDGDRNVDVRSLHVDGGVAWVDEFARAKSHDESLVGVDLGTGATRRIELGPNSDLTDLGRSQAFVIDDTIQGADVTRVDLLRVELSTGATTRRWGTDAFAAKVGGVTDNYEPDDARIVDAAAVTVLGGGDQGYAVSWVDSLSGDVRWTTPIGLERASGVGLATSGGVSFVVGEFRRGVLDVVRVARNGAITARSQLVVPSGTDYSPTVVAGPNGVYLEPIINSKEFDTGLIRLDPVSLRPTAAVLVADGIVGEVQSGPLGVWLRSEACQADAWDQWRLLDPHTLTQRGPVRLEPRSPDAEHDYQLDARTSAIWQLDLEGFPARPVMLRRWTG